MKNLYPYTVMVQHSGSGNIVEKYIAQELHEARDWAMRNVPSPSGRNGQVYLSCWISRINGDEAEKASTLF